MKFQLRMEFISYETTIEWGNGDVSLAEEVYDEEIESRLSSYSPSSKPVSLLDKIVSTILKLKTGEEIPETVKVWYRNDGTMKIYNNPYIIRAYQYLKYKEIPCFPVLSTGMRINKLFDNKYKYVNTIYSNYKEFIICTKEGKEVIIKSSDNDISREYEVGLALAKYNKSYFVNVHDYKFEKGESWLVMDRVKGVTLREYTKDLSESEMKHILKYLTYICMELHELQITHYDLHFANILVEKLEHPIDLPFVFGGEKHFLTTNVVLKIIDYNSMYLKEVTSTNFDFDDAKLYYGMLPIMFDPEYDIQTIFGFLYELANKYLPTTYKLLQGNFVCFEKLERYMCLVGREYAILMDTNYGTDYKSLQNADFDNFDLDNEHIKHAIDYKKMVIEERENKITDIYAALVVDLEL